MVRGVGNSDGRCSVAKCTRPAYISVRGEPLCEHHWEKHLKDIEAEFRKIKEGKRPERKACHVSLRRP